MSKPIQANQKKKRRRKSRSVARIQKTQRKEVVLIIFFRAFAN